MARDERKVMTQRALIPHTHEARDERKVMTQRALVLENHVARLGACIGERDNKVVEVSRVLDV